uniref:Uncharacterized protein n=1 Tax=Anguilla anguilla TaxID=7936 RepID=A0A0E9QLT8_ANGAN
MYLPKHYVLKIEYADEELRQCKAESGAVFFVRH